jgi:hypothetical protein
MRSPTKKRIIRKKKTKKKKKKRSDEKTGQELCYIKLGATGEKCKQ